MTQPRVDPHNHSRRSDGTEGPAELVKLAAEAGLTIALTDHDTFDGIPDAAAALRPGQILIPGVEISTSVEVDGVRGTQHLLGYFCDPENRALADTLGRIRDSRDTRAQKMVGLLAAAGHPISWDEVIAEARGVVGKPHIATVLVRNGVVTSRAEAYSAAWLGDGSPYHVRKEQPDLATALSLVRGAGGVAVLAHPRRKEPRPPLSPVDIAALADAGLAGIEVFHPNHGDTDRAELLAIAKRLDLIVTGCSDFHGANKPQRLGAETTAFGEFQRLLDAATAPGTPLIIG
ncbi:PHP domain-containing protein [Frankia sp. ACN10a]|uniref:PHP domain-containing protein n=1 Tax=Frankia sp. ACN10a TaxID=2926031 RepID=UPI002118DD78|nr:PHP domain-containing protein [Frankia sp. ACN10a]